MATPPLIVAALWSRAWLGSWAILSVAAAAAWTWLDPRAFPLPRSFECRASKGCLGERVRLDRDRSPVPPRHRLAPRLLMLAKFWFWDRMAWLDEDVNGAATPRRGATDDDDDDADDFDRAGAAGAGPAGGGR